MEQDGRDIGLVKGVDVVVRQSGFGQGAVKRLTQPSFGTHRPFAPTPPAINVVWEPLSPSFCSSVRRFRTCSSSRSQPDSVAIQRSANRLRTGWPKAVVNHMWVMSWPRYLEVVCRQILFDTRRHGMTGLEQAKQTPCSFFVCFLINSVRVAGQAVSIHAKLSFTHLSRSSQGKRMALLFIPFFVLVVVFLPTVSTQKIALGLAGHMKPADCLTRQKQRAMLPQRVRKLKSRHWSPPCRASLPFFKASISLSKGSSLVWSDGVSSSFAFRCLL